MSLYRNRLEEKENGFCCMDWTCYIDRKCVRVNESERERVFFKFKKENQMGLKSLEWIGRERERVCCMMA